MNSYCRVALLLAAVVQLTAAHSFHFGDCPKVQPMSGFNMEKFLGKWYVIQKTKSSNKNQVLTYSHGDEEGEYEVLEDAVRPVIGRQDYSGKLKPSDEPAKMTVKFKLNPGSYDYIVFMTDYENYAGVFSCQKVLGTNRRAASILSRRPTLEKYLIEKVRDRLSYFEVNPFDLSVIEQKDDEGSVRQIEKEEELGPIWDVDPRFGQTTPPPSANNASDLHLF